MLIVGRAAALQERRGEEMLERLQDGEMEERGGSLKVRAGV